MALRSLIHGRAVWMATLTLAFFLLFLSASSSFGQQDSVLTYHFDNYRSGQMTDETILVPANVTTAKFGKLFSDAVDGFIVAQPLYLPNVVIPGKGTHNVVYVVTQHDSVYAFDADTAGPPLWHVSFLSSGVTTVPISQEGCTFIGFTEIGIMGTPVIDPTTGTLYLSAKTETPVSPPTNPATFNYFHTLHALDVTTGAERFGGPSVVNASVVNPQGNTISFDSFHQYQRPAMLFSNGTLFVEYGSNGCDFNAHGWVMAYDGNNLQRQLAVFNTSPTPSPTLATGASLWMSGSGIATDSTGGLYLSTANGPYDGITDWGDTVLNLSFSNNDALAVTDSFTPFDQNTMYVNDLDLGSGGVTLIDQSTGLNQHLLVTSGKAGNVYLVNRDGMGGYNPQNKPPQQNNTNIVQYLPDAVGSFKSTPVYWSGNNQVYFAARNDTIKAFQLVDGLFSPTTPITQSAVFAQLGVPVLSSSGPAGGILWNIHDLTAPRLSALDATTLVELYNSAQNAAGRDTLGMVAHFASPAIANEKVYVGTTTNLSVYGVFPYLALLGGNGQSAAVTSPLAAPLTVQAINSQGNAIPGVSITFSDGGKGGKFSSPTVITDSTGTATTNYTVSTKAGPITITAAAAPAYRNVLLNETATPGPASVLAKISGINQSATAGTALPSPVVVDLRDAFGNGIVGQAVNFTDSGAGGSFSSNPVITGAAGSASVSYTVPTTAKYIVVTASFGTITAPMAEHSVAGPATTVSVNSGNNQSAPPNTNLKLLVVKVTDQFGNPISGASVAFSDGGANGTFSTTPAITNLAGQANTTYTTPAKAQVVTIKGTVSGLSPAVFTETVQ